MNIYKIKYNKGAGEQYVVASSFSEAEGAWVKDPDRYKIEHIELISNDIMVI